MHPLENNSGFFHRHRVRYYETDSMGVVHHSNFLRIFEEARVEWLRARNLLEAHAPHADLTLAVVETSCRHLRPAYLEDDLKIHLQVRLEGATKIYFRYQMYSPRFEKPIATGTTVHVPLNGELKVTRLPEPLRRELEKETWTETWP